MKTLSALRLAAAIGLSLSAATAAQAVVYNFNWTPSSPQPVGGGYEYNATGGAIEFINASYDTATQRLTYDVQYNGSLVTRGFWLALSDGPNPKNQSGNLTLFYFDGTNFASPKLSAYVYNGQNDGSSWNDGNGPASGSPAGDLIKGTNETAGFINSISAGDSGGKRRFKFDINVAGINSYNPIFDAPDGSAFEGADFGPKLGIWFHSLGGGTSFSYNSGRGGIKTFNPGSKQGWLDGNNFLVPAPSALALIGMGGLVAARRRRTA